MILRKINAGLSLLLTFLLLAHAISVSIWMLSAGEVAKPMAILPWVLTGLMAVHAFISIDMAISGHLNGGNLKGKQYPKLNVSTIVQRVTGGLMVVFTGLHIGGATKFMQPPKVIHAILPPLFFVVALAHTAVSANKALITLGIGNAAFVKAADVVVKVICAVTCVADLIGFYLYLC